MLIVVVVLVTLMSITFRLSSLGDDQTRRSRTIARLQRVENCLSGYYAAFGTYPPVQNHGFPDFHEVNANGIQRDEVRQLSLGWYQDTGNHGIGTASEVEDWKIVEATCRVQPLAAEFLYPEGYNEYFKAEYESKIRSGKQAYKYSDGYTENAGSLNLDTADWRETQLFKFGVMSFILPRFMLMMCAGSDNSRDIFEQSRQWNDNNRLPCNPVDGTRFPSWRNIKEAMENVYLDGIQKSSGQDVSISQAVMLMPSQAACIRWLPNLEESCYTTHEATFYGIQISESHKSDGSEGEHHLESQYQMARMYHNSGPNSGAGGDLHSLDIVTVCDGWNHELYYYSPPPYQGYRLWSAGPNGRTFPPWISREGLGSKNRCVGAWIDDDIVNMSH